MDTHDSAAGEFLESRALTVRACLCGGIAALLFACASLLSHANGTTISPETRARHEARYEKLAHELRCLVCQNQSLAESGAELAGDLKREVRRMIALEKTDAEIKAFLQSRFGDFVLYDPPVKSSTLVLWLGPLFLLGLSLVLAHGALRRRLRSKDDVQTSHAITPEKELDRLLK